MLDDRLSLTDVARRHTRGAHARRNDFPPIGLVALLSLGAGVIHFDIIGARWHEHIVYGLFFIVLAVFQVAWGFGVAVRPRRLYAVGIVVNALTLAIYVVAHTTGLPVGPEAWKRVPSGAADIICAFFELGVIVLSLELAFRYDSAPPWRSAARYRWSLPDRLAAGTSAVLVLFVVVGTGAALGTTGGTTSSAKSTSGARSGHTHTAATSSGSSKSTSRSTNGVGIGIPDPSTWRYTGAPLPASETGQVTGMWKVTAPGQAMQSPACTAKPTAAQQAAAARLVSATNAAVAKYRDFNVAKADGYVPITAPQYVLAHYMKHSNLTADKVLDPNHIQALLYLRRPNGQMVLAAAVYAMPKAGERGPMPGGCLTQWHAQTNLCMLPEGYFGGIAPCQPGAKAMPTPELFYVWQIPVPGGSLAVDPPDLQVAEAGEMYATSHGGDGTPTG